MNMNILRITGALMLTMVTISGCSKQPSGPTEPISSPATTNLEKSLSAPVLSSSEFPVFNPANGHYYDAISVSEGINWDDAKAEAEAREFDGYEGHLATITSQEENDFIFTNLPQAFPPGAGFWLGGFQQLPAAAPDEGWTWVTGEPFVFTNWQSGEPNDYQGMEEDALHFHDWDFPINGKWNDISRSALEAGLVVPGYVVEYEPRGVRIDIKPGDKRNRINCTRPGRIIPVAVVTENGFDATTVEPSTVRFGRSGTEALPIRNVGLKIDVDRDGDFDMLMAFRLGDTGIQCGDTEATLTGRTKNGKQIRGTDSVLTVGEDDDKDKEDD